MKTMLADAWDGVRWWWVEGASDFVVPLLVVLAVLALSFGTVTFGFVAWVNYAGPRYCDAATAGMPMPHRWSFWGDCQVQTAAAGWLPLENVRLTVVEHQGSSVEHH